MKKYGKVWEYFMNFEWRIKEENSKLIFCWIKIGTAFN